MAPVLGPEHDWLLALSIRQADEESLLEGIGGIVFLASAQSRRKLHGIPNSDLVGFICD